MKAFLIHGFTGGTWEIEPLQKELERQGYQTCSPTLAGHSGTRSDLKIASSHDYIAGIERDFLAFANEKPVELIGFSMGSLIAVHLAVTYPHLVAKLVLLAPPVYPIHFYNTLRTLNKRSFIENYIKKLFATPAFARQQFYVLVKRSREHFALISQPTLLIQGKRDHLVSMKSSTFIKSTIPPKLLHTKYYPNAGHLLLHGPEKKDVISDILHFLSD
jgi:esterase/lipase